MAFKDVLESGITMMAAHRAINSKMQSERLPSINYRISADYGVFALKLSSVPYDILRREDRQFGIYILAVCSGLTGKAFNDYSTAYRTGKKHCRSLKVHYPLIALLHDIQGINEVWTKV